MYAPVIVFAYRRLDKIKECLESVRKCDIAGESDLYIFADGPKGTQDEQDVRNVVSYLEDAIKEGGFKKTELIKSEYNCGLAASVINGVSDVIEDYGKAVVIEDDLTVAKDFLVYMNKALDFYENDRNIWSVTGYTQPLKSLSRYDHDIYYGYRGCTYGWGTWKDRWESVDWEVTSYHRFLASDHMKKLFRRGGGDMPLMLKHQMEGRLDSWGIRWCFAQSMQDRYTVYPARSLVINHGYDGSGTHKSVQEGMNDYSHVYGEEIKLEHLYLDKRISREFYYLHTDTIDKKIKRNLKKILKR